MKHLIYFILTATVALSSISTVFADDATTNDTNYSDDSISDKYSEIYKAGIYQEDTAMPTGTYVIMAEENKIGSFRVYDKAEDEDIYKESFDYCTIARIADNSYVELKNAYAIPSDEVGPLDTTRNGVFRAGIDIPTGKLTFKKHNNTTFSNVENFYMGTLTYYKSSIINDDIDFCNIDVRDNSLIAKYNCDIYKNGTLISEYNPLATYNDTTKLSDVSSNLRNKVTTDIAIIRTAVTSTSINSDKLQKKYISKMADNWKKLAVNDCDNEYIQKNYNALICLSDYFRLVRNTRQRDDSTVYSAKGNGTPGVSSKFHNEIARSLNKELYNLINADSFNDIDVVTSSIVSCISATSVNLNNISPNFRFGY